MAGVQDKHGAFLSYARADDSSGEITNFHAALQNALRQHWHQDARIFIDKEIPAGEDWHASLLEQLNEVEFFIAMVTPNFLRSDRCREEFQVFVNESVKGKLRGRVVPVLTIDCDEFARNSLYEELRTRNFADFREVRFLDRSSGDFRKFVDKIASDMRRTVPIDSGPPDPGPGEIRDIKVVPKRSWVAILSSGRDVWIAGAALALAVVVGLGAIFKLGHDPSTKGPDRHSVVAPKANDPTPDVETGLAKNAWPKFRCDNGNTNLASGHAAKGVLKWSIPIRTGGRTGVAVGSDGTIYVGSTDHHLYALNPDASEKWAFPTRGAVYSSPAIGASGTIYFGSNDGNVYAVNADGTPKWHIETDGAVESSPAIGKDETVYVGSGDGRLYAISSAGKRLWALRAHGSLYSSPAVGADGTVYIASGDTKMYAVDPAGSTKWAMQVGVKPLYSPSIAHDGTLLAGSPSGMLYEITQDGQRTSSLRFQDGPVASPAVYEGFSVLVASGTLYCIDSAGRTAWSRPGAMCEYTPAIAADGTIYVGDKRGFLYAYDGKGTLVWARNTGSPIGSSPVIGPDGTVYIESGSHRLEAIR